MHRRCLKTSTLFTILIAILPYSLCAYGSSLAFGDQGHVRVIKAHDGDTVSVILNGRKEKVRLIGIDAPEIKQRPWGTRARKHLEKMLTASNRTVILEFDVERRDKYGRLLCYVYSTDKNMINLQMLKHGYAVLLTIPPNVRHVDEFRKAQHNAREQKLGIWGSSTPSEFREKHPRN
ncbi:MAG: thermonuclease family protein [Thermodesulfovibrionales bacterium]